VPAIGRRLQRKLRRQDLVLLGEEQRYGSSRRSPGPTLVLRELAPQPLALDEVRVGPEMDVLVEGAELGRPRAFELAVLVPRSDGRPRKLSLRYSPCCRAAACRSGARRSWSRLLIDTRVSDIDTGPSACRRRSPSGVDNLPVVERRMRRRSGAPRRRSRTCRSTRAPSSWPPR